MIRLEQLSKVYSSKSGSIKALDDINLEVAKGEIFGIIGKSGAGKSTLIRCANLLDVPTTGKVWVDGSDLTQLPPKELRFARHHIAMIFQHFNLLSSRTVYQNIALPLYLTASQPATIDKKVSELLELVELTDKKDSYPSQLSGGQKQRVAIARALACDPKVLLCDEATSALDPKTTESILSLLRKINRELHLTILLITHEMSVVQAICDRVAVLEQGQIIEQADIMTLFTQPQTETTKNLIQSTIRPPLPERIAQQLLATPADNRYPVIQISFYGESAGEPVIAELITRLGIKVTILQAKLDYLRGDIFGVMVVELITSQEQYQQAFTYLTKIEIPWEILGYVERPPI